LNVAIVILCFEEKGSELFGDVCGIGKLGFRCSGFRSNTGKEQVKCLMC
jgi:hypothetical protein